MTNRVFTSPASAQSGHQWTNGFGDEITGVTINPKDKHFPVSAHVNGEVRRFMANGRYCPNCPAEAPQNLFDKPKAVVVYVNIDPHKGVEGHATFEDAKRWKTCAAKGPFEVAFSPQDPALATISLTK